MKLRIKLIASLASIILLSSFAMAQGTKGKTSRKRNNKKDDQTEAAAPVASPDQQTPKFSEDSLFVTLERTACFGQCPTYKIEIYLRGLVMYHGYNYVDHVGDFSTTITKDKLKKIFDYAKDIKFYTLKDSYINPSISDFPTTITTMKVKGNKKSIVDGHSETPSELIFFEKMIDDMFKDTEWKVINKR